MKLSVRTLFCAAICFTSSLWLSSAVAGPPVISTVEEAGELANEVFERVEGAAMRARQQGTRDARAAARQPLRSWTIDAAPGIQLTDNAEIEHEFGTALWFDLGPRSRRARQAWDAAGDAIALRSDADRWIYVTEAERLFAQWWAKQAIADHLKEDLEIVVIEIDVWTQTLSRYFSALDLLDADAEATKISMEVTEALLEAQSAEAAFRAHIAVRVELVLVEESHESIDAAGQHNPWKPLLDDVARLPQLRSMEADAVAQEAHARASRARTTGLGVGASTRLTDGGNVLLSPTVSLEIPIARANAEDAAIARAEAIALRAEASWKATTLHVWLEGEAARHDALVRATQAIDGEAVDRLRTRLEQLQAALAAGHVDVRRVFWARRDLHEALHQALLLRAELAASEAAASGVKALIERSTP